MIDNDRSSIDRSLPMAKGGQVNATRPDEGSVHFHDMTMASACTEVHEAHSDHRSVPLEGSYLRHCFDCDETYDPDIPGSRRKSEVDALRKQVASIATALHREQAKVAHVLQMCDDAAVIGGSYLMIRSIRTAITCEDE